MKKASANTLMDDYERSFFIFVFRMSILDLTPRGWFKELQICRTIISVYGDGGVGEDIPQRHINVN